MIRIRFPTDQDRVQGNYLLATQSVVRCLRGQVFEVSEADGMVYVLKIWRVGRRS